MAHHSLQSHFKLKELARLLDISEVTCIGHLECLWWSAYSRPDVGPDGVLAGWKENKIAWSSQWQGDHKQFVQALCTVEFLDQVEDGYAIHDYSHWAPDYVKKRVAWTGHRKATEDSRDGWKRPASSGHVQQRYGSNGSNRRDQRTQPKSAGVSELPEEKKTKTDPKKPRQPNPLWDAIAALWFPPPPKQDPSIAHWQTRPGVYRTRCHPRRTARPTLARTRAVEQTEQGHTRRRPEAVARTGLRGSRRFRRNQRRTRSRPAR